MNQLIKTTHELEGYKCRKCGRDFYIHKQNKSDMDINFGCCFGCDDNGRYIRDVRIEIQQENDALQLNVSNRDTNSEIEKQQIVITLFESDFEKSIGRKPKDQGEFDKWVRKANIALFNGCLNWDRFYECATFGFLYSKKR